LTAVVGPAYDAGALALAPTSITAVILAAGEGTRLHPYTRDRPKCLVDVGGRPLLARALDALAAAGLTDVVIVTGYREDVLQAFLTDYPRPRVAGAAQRITTIRNDEYARTNNAYSLWTARARVPGPMILLDGDLLFAPEVALRVLASAGEAVLAVDRRDDLGDEEMKVSPGPDGTILAVNKTMDPRASIGESIGVARFTASAAQALWDRLGAQIAAGQRNVFYELAFEQLIAAGWSFVIADVSGLPCMEIDTPDDLAAAQRLAERMEGRPLAGAPVDG
jgi:choline kinase